MEQSPYGWPLRLWVGLLTAVVVAPVLRPGQLLQIDLVTVPRQTLTPDSLGVGEALPRAVPVDAVVALVTRVVDGQWVAKGLLVGVLLLSGFGAARLVPTRRQSVAAIAATAYVWNPYVAERMLLGHWWLLLSYALIPWTLLAVRAYVRGASTALVQIFLIVLAGSIVPTGGMLLSTTALVSAAVGLRWRARKASVRALAGVVGVVVAAQLPWLVPAVLRPPSSGDPAAIAAFAARADTIIGTPGSVLGLGGVWDAGAVPTSRGLFPAALGVLLALAGAAYGWSLLRERWPAKERGALVALAVLGVVLATFTSAPWGARTAASLVETLPASGLFRDAQKWVALAAPGLAVLVALGAERLASGARDRTVSGAVLVGSLLLPIVVLPDLAWGVGGRIVPTHYPEGWEQARHMLASSSGPGDVLVLPWGAFRAFTWNRGQTSLDPAPRWSPRPTVIDDRLQVGHVLLAGESARSRTISRQLIGGSPSVDELARLGVGWILVEHDTPGVLPAGLLATADPVLAGGSVDLYRVPGRVASTPVLPGASFVAIVDVLVLLGAGVAAILALRLRIRRRLLDSTNLD